MISSVAADEGLRG
jgi:3-hydroxyacyl-CoA dehydrogenase / 3-hydroxy-2-methylbutyryl-CoA dehydrogenase